MVEPPIAAAPPTHRVGGPAARRCLRLVARAAPGTVAIEAEADAATLGLDGPELALALDRSTGRHDVDGAAGTELYPVPGAGGLTDLAPFETRVVALGAAGIERAPLGRPTRRLDLATLGAQLTDRRQGHTSVALPAIARGDHVVLLLRLLRDGQWLYHPDPRELFDVRMRVFGIEVPIEAVPRARSRNGPGYPWVRYATAAGEAWSGESLVVEVASSAGPDVEVVLEALVFDPWWTTHSRRFPAPDPGAASAPAPTARAEA